MFGLNVPARLVNARSPWQRFDGAAQPPWFDDVREYVTARIRRCFPVPDNPAGVAVDRHRTSTNPVFRFTFTQRPAVIAAVAKWCYSDASNDEGLAEYTHFTRFNALREAADLTCPMVLGYLPEIRVIATLYEPAPLLLHELAPVRRWSSSWKAGCERAGRWLVAFHSIHRYRAALGSVPDEFHRLCSLLADGTDEAFSSLMDGTLGPGRAKEVGRLVRHVHEARNSIVCDIGTFHGDFGPSNILSAPDRLTVLDAARQKDGPQLSDLAAFWAGTLLCAKFRGMPDSSIAYLHRAFLNSYERQYPLGNDDKVILAAFQCALLARHMYRHYRQLRGMLPPIRLAVQRLLRTAYRDAFTRALTFRAPEVQPAGYRVGMTPAPGR